MTTGLFVLLLILVPALGCEPGAFRGAGGACFSCMAGTYTSARDSTHCRACAVGRFANESGASACQACAPGSFQYSTGNSGCAACAPGTFQAAPGSTACLQCGAGSVQANEGMAGCEACAPGRYAWSDGATACAKCASGSHQPGDGATACLACGAGSAQGGEGMAACRGCAPGSYQPEEGQTACWACGSGEFQAAAGSTSCAPCPAGTAHREQGRTGPDACLACPPGQFKAAPGDGGCGSCPAGKHAPNPGASACADCAPGYHQPLEGASACLPCAPGTYGLECAPCRPGTYSGQEGASSAEACRACAAGAYSTGWGSPAECVPCPLGTHRPAESEGACLACPERAFCPEGSAGPILCEAEGLVCSGTRLDAGPGMLAYLNGTTAVAIACPPGTLCALGGEDKGLLDAWPNRVHFVVLWDGSHRRVDWPFHARPAGILFWLAPRNCREGWFMRGEECAPCRNGTFSTRPGAMTARACRPCAPGRYASSPGAIDCPFCQAGTYASSTGMLACPRCWAGGFQSASGGSACHACLPGKYSAAPGASTCLDCLAGTAQPAVGASACIACNASAEYSSDGDAACLPCAVSPAPVPPLDPPPPSKVWVAVRGPDDLCVRRAESTTERVLAWRLGAGTRCRHVLRALGRSGEYSGWDEPPPPSAPQPARLVVVARNDTFYPEECRRARLFEVLFTLWDDEGGLIQPADADLSILDSTGAHLLFRAKCELSQHACATRAFCPTVDVLVRVAVAGVSGSVRIAAGHGQACPPPPGWSLALLAEGAGQPFLDGEALRVGLHVRHSPGHLLAYRLSLQVFQPFAFAAFEGVGQCEEALDGRLAVRGDLSALAGPDFLGRLTLRLGTGRGLVRALRVLSAEFMLLQGAWLAVPVQCGGFACGRDLHLRVLVDHPRPTALVARASRQTLVHWRGVQAGAGVFPAAIEAWAVQNAGRPLLAVEGLECRSATPRVLRVVSCGRIEPAGPGKGVVRVRHGGVETSVHFQVLQPRVMRAGFLPDDTGRRGRVEVLAMLDGAALDITPFVLGRASSPGVRLVLGDELQCLPDFVGEFALGEPALLSGSCPPASRSRPDLHLLSGGWTRRGGFALNPGMLLMGHAGADILLFEAEVHSEDPGRAVVREEDGRLYMVLGCQTPRNVVLRSGDGWAWTVQVVPPAPASLAIEMSATVLAVQQDVWGGVVPSVARLVKATLLFSDGSATDVTQSPRLLCSTDDALGLKVLPGCAVQTFTEAGHGELLFGMRGLGCVSAAVQLRVFASSVVHASLTCPACPAAISARDDPLAQQEGIPLAAFVVRRLLVDGREDASPSEALQVDGDGMVEQGRVVGLREGELVVTAPHATGLIRVRVLARWATGFRLRCNDSPSCEGVKLAPPGDGASLAPFQYPTRLDLALELLLANDTVRRYDQLPQVSILYNGSESQPTLVPGDLELRVVFGPAWSFPQPETRFVLHVATLVSLSLKAPALLRQLHCTRVWERLPLRVLAGLSDGGQAELPLQRFNTTGVLRVTPMGLLYAAWEGEGVVSTSFAGRTVRASVAAAFDNRLFAGVDLDVPATFRSGLGDLLLVVAALVPRCTAPGVQAKALRWAVSEPGVLAEGPGDTLVLRSDFPGPVKVSAIVRSCQGADPVVEERAVQVNVAPTRKGQVDFGADAGPPLPQVAVGETLEIPVFVYAPDAPLLGFRATLSLPGLDRLECAVGELPLSACEAQADGSVALSGAYPASQRTGRLHLGSLRGVVVLDALSRLRVALHTASFGPLDDAGNVTYEFGVRLGRPRRARNGLNSVTPGLLGPLVLPAYAPRSLQACCGAVLAIPGTRLSGLLPRSFRLERVWLVLLDGATADLSLDDLRLDFQYDPALLTHAHGLFTAQTGALGTTEIRVVYTEAGSLRQLSAGLSVVFARPLALELDPPGLELRRLHCTASSFQAGRFQARLVLADVDEPVLLRRDSLRDFASSDTLVLAAEPGSLRVEGRRVGEAGVLLAAFGLEARAHVLVRDDSVLLTGLTLEDPYVLSSARDEPHRLRLRASWEDGGDWPFLPSLRADGPVTVVDGGALVPQGNTHPAGPPCWLSVTIPACQNQSRITARSRLVVRLLANLTRQRPADVLVAAGDSFNVSLAVADRVSAFFVRLYTDTPITAWTPAAPGPLFDCALLPGGLMVLAGAGITILDGLLLLRDVRPMPARLWGDVEVFDGTATVRAPITAGQFGLAVAAAPSDPGRPVVDAGTLARRFLAGDREGAASALDLLTERARVVDARLYSNDREISVMLRVLDRFLRPDAGLDVAVGLDGARHPAGHVVDGWYAYQFVGDVPRREIRVWYELLGRRTDVPEPLVAGRALHACPRVAVDRASFQLVYRLHAPPDEGLAARVACQAHVALRRVAVQRGPDGVFTLTVAVESFIRMQQAHQALIMLGGNLSIPLRRTGLLYVNDTADRLQPCPPGTYFSAANGTYERLPLHALAGPDCYGMVCAEGYTLLNGQECVPAALGLDVAWVCVSVILGLIALVSCCLCLLQMGRRPACVPDVSLPTDSQHSGDPFLEDDPEFKNILAESYLDDYARTLLDDEFSVIPMEPAVVRC